MLLLCCNVNSTFFQTQHDDKQARTIAVQTDPVVCSCHHSHPTVERKSVSVATEDMASNAIVSNDHGYAIKESLLSPSHQQSTYATVKHQYDLWHIVKGVKKKLAKRKIAALSAWIKAVANHLWYCAATCDGDALLLKEMWTSILFHVTNRHHWATGEKFHRCSHEPYSEESERSRAWLEVESDAFKVLQGVVLDKTLLKSLSLVC